MSAAQNVASLLLIALAMIGRGTHIGYKGAMINRLVWIVSGLLFLFPTYFHAQGVSIIEYEKVQLARSLAAVVHDPTGSPNPGVLVEECSSDWKESLRSTKTDSAGGFTFVPVKGRSVYYLQLRMNGLNPLRVRVKLDSKHGKNLQLTVEVAT
jgi:hypothetical protein